MRLRSVLGFAVGPIATAVLGLFAVPVMAWVFPPADVGRLNVLQIAISFSLLFLVLGLDQAYVREYHEAKNKAQLLKSCFIPGFILLLLSAGVSVFFSVELAGLLYAESDPRLYLMTVAAFFSAYFSRFFSLILRMQERGWAYSTSQILPKLVQLLLVTFVVLTEWKRDFALLQGILLTSMVSVFLLYAWNTRKEWRGAIFEKIDKEQLRQLLKFGFPLVFSGLTYWGLAATSTFALRIWSPLEELAVYSVAHSFAGAAIVFQSIFTVVWAPAVYKWVSQGVDMKIVDAVAQQALAVVCALIAVSGSFSWLCDFLLPDQYAAVKYILLCMLMQPLLYTLSEITCVGIAIERRTIYSVWIALAALVANILLSFFLVPAYGAPGAAVANAMAFTVFFVARTEVSARIWRRFPRSRLYGYMAAFLFSTLITVFGGSMAPITVHLFWVVVLLASLFFFRKEWREIFHLLRSRRRSPK